MFYDYFHVQQDVPSYVACSFVCFQGCYDAGLQYLKENSVILIGLGLGIAVLLVSEGRSTL